MILILYFDNKYFKWAEPYIKSIEFNEPEMKIVIYGYNLAEEQVNNLNTFKSVIYINNEKMKFDPIKSDLFRFQLTCRKGYFLLSTMKKYPKENYFMITDVDMLMVNPLTEFKKIINFNDAGLVVIGKSKVAGGFLIFKRSAGDFLKRFHQLAFNDSKLYLSKDQKTLYKVYKEFSKKLKLYSLSRKYIDHELELDSYVWSAHKEYKYGIKDNRLKLFKYISENLSNKKDIEEKLKRWKSKTIKLLEKEENDRREEKEENDRRKKS